MTHTTLGQAMGATCRQALGEHDEGVAHVMSCVGEALAARPRLLPHQHESHELEQMFPTMPLLDEDQPGIGEDFVDDMQRFDVEDMGEHIAMDLADRARREGRRRKMFDDSC